MQPTNCNFETLPPLPVIYESSKIFRRLIERVDINKWGQDGPFRKFQYFPRNCCVITSHLLARYLIRDCEVMESVSIVHGEHPKDGWHYWVELCNFVIDITADQFDELRGEEIIVGATDWHNKCVILDRSTVYYDFTDINEGCDCADQKQLEYAYNQLVCSET